MTRIGRNCATKLCQPECSVHFGVVYRSWSSSWPYLCSRTTLDHFLDPHPPFPLTLVILIPCDPTFPYPWIYFRTGLHLIRSKGKHRITVKLLPWCFAHAIHRWHRSKTILKAMAPRKSYKSFLLPPSVVLLGTFWIALVAKECYTKSVQFVCMRHFVAEMSTVRYPALSIMQNLSWVT